MELRQIQYALALAEKLHFHRASEELHISEPTLSQQIRQLERELGVDLFRRDRHGTELTAAGATFVANGRHILSLVQSMVDATRLTAMGQAGRLAVGAVGSASVGLVPRMLARYRASYPGVMVDVVETSTARQLQAVGEGGLDVAFVRTPVVDSTDRLVFEVVVRESLLVALPAGHPLATGDAVPLDALRHEPLVLFHRTEGPGFYDRILHVFERHTLVPRIAFELTNVHTILGFVANGLGVSLLPASFLSCGQNGVVMLPVALEEESLEPIELAMAWLPDNANPCLPALLEEARAAGRHEPWEPGQTVQHTDDREGEATA